MGLENLNAVDAVGIETESDYVVLSIIDSWDWSNERSHLLALQGKLNCKRQSRAVFTRAVPTSMI